MSTTMYSWGSKRNIREEASSPKPVCSAHVEGKTHLDTGLEVLLQACTLETMGRIEPWWKKLHLEPPQVTCSPGSDHFPPEQDLPGRQRSKLGPAACKAYSPLWSCDPSPKPAGYFKIKLGRIKYEQQPHRDLLTEPDDWKGIFSGYSSYMEATIAPWNFGPGLAHISFHISCFISKKFPTMVELESHRAIKLG